MDNLSFAEDELKRTRDADRRESLMALRDAALMILRERGGE
jgi:hypothetical protein